MAKKITKLSGFSEVSGRIQNLITTEIFETEFSPVSLQDLKDATVNNGWAYNWAEFADAFRIVKINTINNPKIVHGLVAFTVDKDYIFMDFIENAPFNRGANKIYSSVAGNLIAFLCHLSQQLGFNGYVVFKSKPQLVDYYISQYDATKHPQQKDILYISPENAQRFINRYLNF